MKNLVAISFLILMAFVISMPLSAGSEQKIIGGKVSIRMISQNATNDFSIQIVTSEKKIILCDPVGVQQTITPNVILVTHPQHLNVTFIMKQKDAKKLICNADEFVVGAIRIKGVKVNHNEIVGEGEQGLDHIIYMMDIEGMRVAYLGCMGQKELTTEQVNVLGKVDIAILSNDSICDDHGQRSSIMNNSISIVKQINPAIVIPLSHNITNFHDAVKKYGVTFGKVEEVKELLLSKGDINHKVMKVVWIKK